MRAVTIIVLCAAVTLAGCAAPGPDDPPTNGTDGTTPDDDRPPVDGQPPSDGRPPPTLPDLTPPDGEAVLDTASGLVAAPDGSPWYRIPGTPGNLDQALHLRDELASRGFDAALQHFNASLPLTGDVPCRNVVGTRAGEAPGEIVLAAHFDSRARADKDPDPARRGEPVLGANDGASGVAVTLHVLDALPQMRHGLRVYFFDCEDQGDGGGGWAVGSQHAAAELTNAEVAAIRALVLFDLVGDAELAIPREGYSDDAAPWLVDMAMGVAEAHGLDAFENRTATSVLDDHLPFIRRGVPAIDLIHLDQSPDRDPFPATHHTSFDDVEHLSADSLGQVAELGLRLVVRLDAHL